MRKLAVVMGVAVLAAVDFAAAGTLDGTARWAEQMGIQGISNRVYRWGIADADDVAAIIETWDEETVVDLALTWKAYRMLALIGRLDSFSSDSVERIARVLRAEEEPPAEVVDVIRRLPPEARREFETMLYGLVDARFPTRPVFGRHYVKYYVLRNEALFPGAAEPVDLVRVLLAPEPMRMNDAVANKRAIKEAAVSLARAKLRADGLSFVVRDGINPLAEAIRPVVEALNAPACAGLEAALRALGGDVPDMDRGAFEKLTGAWQAALMAGEITGSAINAVIGKVSVALGVDGFNAFVDRYNHGTGGSGNGAE